MLSFGLRYTWYGQPFDAIIATPASILTHTFLQRAAIDPATGTGARHSAFLSMA